MKLMDMEKRSKDNLQGKEESSVKMSMKMNSIITRDSTQELISMPLLRFRTDELTFKQSLLILRVLACMIIILKMMSLLI
jgi:hypothetical protein